VIAVPDLVLITHEHFDHNAVGTREAPKEALLARPRA
jgi:L-ascorbate metabolism protein UlaG (beta-lactamase superfamily)